MSVPAPVRTPLAAACGFLLAAALSCGVKGPPRPPAPRQPEAARGLEVRQEGEGIVVSFKPPAKRADGGPLALPLRADILVVAGQRPGAGGPGGPQAAVEGAAAIPAAGGAGPVPGSPLPAARMTGREVGFLMKRARAVRSLIVEDTATRASVRLGPEEFPGVRMEGSRLTFGVAVTDARGRRAAPTEIAAIEPVPSPPAPEGLEASMTAQGVTLRWRPPAIEEYPREHGDPETRIYRWREGEDPPRSPLKTLDSDASGFTDSSAEDGERLLYAVRLGVGESPPRRESRPAGPVAVHVRDTFPPSVPEGIAAVAEPGAIRLFWYPSPEEDTAGYIVYRADGEGAPFRPLLGEPLGMTTWQDRDVIAGRNYLYRVTAVDRSSPPNESGPSETVPEEAIPPDWAPPQ